MSTVKSPLISLILTVAHEDLAFGAAVVAAS